MKDFISKYKTYIIIAVVLVLSTISIVVENINSKSKIEVGQEELEKNKYDGKICVYVAGEVENPGVYYLDEGARVNLAIECAGGFTSLADIEDINLAEILNDSDKIEVPKIIHEDDVESVDSMSLSSGKININTATVEELKTLTGIGESTAKKIVEYRKNNKFNSIEDIKNVSGVGDSKFEAIKEYICVK